MLMIAPPTFVFERLTLSLQLLASSLGASMPGRAGILGLTRGQHSRNGRYKTFGGRSVQRNPFAAGDHFHVRAIQFLLRARPVHEGLDPGHGYPDCDSRQRRTNRGQRHCGPIQSRLGRRGDSRGIRLCQCSHRRPGLRRGASGNALPRKRFGDRMPRDTRLSFRAHGLVFGGRVDIGGASGRHAHALATRARASDSPIAESSGSVRRVEAPERSRRSNQACWSI